MKTLYVFKKSLVEQVRDYWALLLTLSAAPFFVVLYWAMTITTPKVYTVEVLNNDKVVPAGINSAGYGNELLQTIKRYKDASGNKLMQVPETHGRNTILKNLQERKSAVLLEIPENFSAMVEACKRGDTNKPVIKVSGDMMNPQYSIAIIYVIGAYEEMLMRATGRERFYTFQEEFIGSSGDVNDFTASVPGLIIFSIIMMLSTAALSIVREIENKTITRLQLTRMTALDYLSGMSLTQIIVSILSVIATFYTAVALGFTAHGSIPLAILVCILTAKSIVGIGLIVASLSKTSGNVLTVGVFPLFLLMWFTGAMYPLPRAELFSIAGRQIALNDVLSPSHAVIALNKVLIHGAGFTEILFEMAAIMILTIVYFLLGLALFRKMHFEAK